MATLDAEALAQAKKELTKSQRAIAAMAGAPDSSTFESAWQEFLNAIHRTWIKAELAGKPLRHVFVEWQRKYRELRDSDPLLQYLAQARHASEHTLQRVIPEQAVPGTIKIEAPPGRDHFTIHAMTGGPQGFKYQGSGVLEFKPAGFDLLTFKNRGVEYAPPTSHRGTDIVGIRALQAAQLAAQFYAEVVEEAAKAFVTSATVDAGRPPVGAPPATPAPAPADSTPAPAPVAAATPPAAGRLPLVPDLDPGLLKARLDEVRQYPCEPPRPERMLADVEEAPPLQRRERSKHYEGMEVRWSGMLVFIRKRQHFDALQLMLVASMKRESEAEGRIFFEVPNAPGWSLVRYGAIFSISGEIDRVSDGSVSLRNVVILAVR